MKKKMAALVLAAVCSLSLIACGSKDASTESAGSVSAKETGETVEGEGLVKLGNYTGLNVNVAKEEPTDTEIENYITYYYATEAKSFNWGEDRTAEMGDTVVIDFVGKIDDVAFEGGTAEDYTIEIGSNTFIAGFEDGMVGMKVGEVRDLNLRFPDNYGNADYAGKDCVFTVTCKSIIPPISDETVAALQNENFSNTAELREYVKGLVTSYYQDDYETSVIAAALEQIVADSTFGTLPEDKMNEMIEFVNSNYQTYADQYGVDLDTYFTMYGTTAEELAAVLVKRDLVFDAIAQAEGFAYTDEEVDAYVQESIDSVDDTVSIEQIYEIESRDQYRKYMILDKVNDYLFSNTIVSETDASTETSAE